MNFLGRSIVLVALSTLVAISGIDDVAGEDKVKFSSQILPLLSNKCFRCHGPDENTRESGLRLDIRDDAIEFGAIVAGSKEDSELFSRIQTEDEDARMPPQDSGVEQLSEAEIRLIGEWISQGAHFEKHWAFIKPQRPELPKVDNARWSSNPIDRLVFHQLSKVGLKPSPPAKPETLARRVSLLTTGLPPSHQAVEQFAQNTPDDVYRKFVDELLSSQAFGERMASLWMDLARYSDTDGFQADEPRTNWPWRDWVIQAYNNNMPFDQFTIEQFAGDLLPNATKEQVLATCFHRNHMTNGEGGRDPEESRVDYVLDRVNTLGTTWLGLTLGCAQCHSHKFDPVSQKDYYQLTAFFNSIDEDGRAGRGAKPYLQWPVENAELQLAQPNRRVQQRKLAVKQSRLAAQKRVSQWIREQRSNKAKLLKQVDASNWQPVQISKISTPDNSVEFTEEEDDDVWRVVKGNPNIVTYTVRGKAALEQVGALRLEALPHASFTAGGLAKSNSGNFVLTNVVMKLIRGNKDEVPRPLEFGSAWADYSQPGFDVSKAIDSAVDTGWAVWSGDMKQPRTAVFRLKNPVNLKAGDHLEVQLVHYSHNPHHNIGRFRLSISPNHNAEHESGLVKILRDVDNDAGLTKSQETSLEEYFIQHDGPTGVAAALLRRAEKQLADAKKKSTIPVMVLKRRTQPRPTYVLERGVWDAHGEKVTAGVPDSILPVEKANQDRLDLAKWIVDPENPLTARVAVNRYWQTYFGAGLVRTPQDFGLQGQHPTHSKLLDWLAVEFIESGWDVKHIHRLIVTSSTFRQSSNISQQLMETDPENRLLARGPRFRMPASMIRDNALAVSGLLTRKVGGPPVKPYQPDNVWSASDQGRYPYELSSGEDLYRRSLYTYWRRNISPPGMFDAAQRRVCELTIRRTNSPMHALTLLNDVTYVEAARTLAQTSRMPNIADSIQVMFKRVLLRTATQSEMDRLGSSYHAYYEEYAARPALAEKLLQVGASDFDKSIEPAELAARTMVASTILNLDETLNVE